MLTTGRPVAFNVRRVPAPRLDARLRSAQEAAREVGRRLLVACAGEHKAATYHSRQVFEAKARSGALSVRDLAYALAGLSEAEGAWVREPLEGRAGVALEPAAVATAIADLVLSDAAYIGAAVLGDLEELEAIALERRAGEERLMDALRRQGEPACASREAM